MTLIRTDSQNYTDIANAIRGLNGDTELYKPSEMIAALDAFVPDYGISYNEDSTVATTYGYKVVGFAGTPSTLTVNISEDAKEIGNYAFYCSNITEFTLPNGITKIGSYAFAYSNIIITSLPDSLTSIDHDAFVGSDITISNIPEAITLIPVFAFCLCDRITSFTFHRNVIKILSNAFYSCNNLTTVTFEGVPSAIAVDAFDKCFNLTTINVPWSEGTVDYAPWGAVNATINYNYTVE